MLEDLETINWHQLTHAYGSADDVPELIRNLASDNADIRGKAINELYSNICHQGTVYEATSYAVPFLIELLQSETVQDKDEILTLLAYLAQGRSYLDVHEISEEPLEPNTPEFVKNQLEKEIELIWVNNVRDAVYAGKDVYLNLLEHNDPNIRMTAAYTLAFCRESVVGIISQMFKHLEQEAEPRVKASMVLSLGNLAVHQPELVESLIKLFEAIMNSEANNLVTLAAAMALAKLAKEQTPPDAVEVLVNVMAEPQLVSGLYSQLPWANGNVVADVSQCLGDLKADAIAFLIPPLMQTLEFVDASSALSIAEMLLYLAFTGKKVSAKVKIEELNETQRMVVKAIAQSDNAWTIDGKMSEILSSFGLPNSQYKLQAF
ncbi:hypothetical protein H6F77_06665 [Microcoleus sp. FACHB-831]|uniref:hypothetical protein n=1 Tax=Microcoleus sp. FACHB-831 TaxID=2692827 RepID=UPI00168729F0|nr:hypothetical protein [Microcoleus sp. FACHB-831]MBD1920766.1 hypothetical protein [Microcoleus sp. FACHB-831]